MPDQTCPWSNYTQATVHYCENHLCSWIVAPAETWSNLAYIFIGIWIWRKSLSNPSDKALKLIAPIAIFTGISSFAYHASGIFIFQVADLSAMFLFSSLLLLLNLKRLGFFKKQGELLFYGVLNALSITLLLIIREKSGMIIFGIQCFAAFLIEVKLAMRAKTEGTLPRTNYRYFTLTIALLAIAFTFWNLDFRHIVCDPDNHILQGHALWHVINSFCFATLYIFYKQFSSVRIS